LYHVLVKLIKVLSPLTPFVTETMYQNLVREVQPEAHPSVHHCLWPLTDQAAIDDELVAQMDLARQVASLGLGARSLVNIKVRQPLAKALVYAGERQVALLPELMDIVMDELNVKTVEFVQDEGALVSYRIVADGRALGPRFGKNFPAVRAALEAVPASQVVTQVKENEPVVLTVAGEEIELLPEEIIIDSEPAEGLSVQSDKGITVAIDSVITPELEAEGLVRDLVRYVQTLRKEADYELSQRITVGLFGLDDSAKAAVESFKDYLQGETLCSIVLLEDDGGAWNARSESKLAGATIEVAVRA